MRDGLLAILIRLHARGLHAAVLAALVMMPAVAAVGYLTRGADRDAGVAHGAVGLRPTLPDPADPRGG